MPSRRAWFLICGLCAAVVAASAAVLLPRFSPRHGVPVAAGVNVLHAYGNRDPRQRANPALGKLDAALADLYSHASAVRADHAIDDLHSMNPAARFRQTARGAAPEVLVDAVTRGDARQLQTALVGLGLEHPARYANDVGGWLPVANIAAVAARPEVVALRASLPHRRAAVALQGDFAQRSDALRSSYPSLTGAGITVGVLSDSFDCYSVYAEPNSGVPASGNNGYAYNGFTATAADDEASGALPASVNVLAEPYNGNCLNFGAPDELPFSDEGRAMLQIVHAVAPGASLAFRTGDDSEADFANGIGALASAGATVIADDLGYYDEPFYQDGIVAQAIDAVVSGTPAVAYFSAAGNDGNAAYENTAPSFATLQPATAANNGGEYLLNFDTTGASIATSLPITLTALVPGEFLAVVVEWDQPYVTGAANSGGATSQIDVCVTGSTSAYLVQDYAGDTVTCTGANSTGVDPVQVLIIGNPANASGNTATENLGISIGLANGSAAPGRILVAVETDGGVTAPITAYQTYSPTLQGHPSAAGAAAVGAAFYFDTPQCGTTPASLESYSSLGGAPILFDSSGNRLATPIQRQKPDFVGPDGVNNTFLGFTLASVQGTGSNVPGSGGTLPTTISQCQNNTNYPNFFGTSAATPHAAGIAALMLQANPAVTPAQIYAALRGSALPMTGNALPVSGISATPNYYAGYGFIQADAALVTPALTLASNAIAAGGSTTLSWSTIYATSCIASAAGTAPAPFNGSVPVNPSTPVALAPTGAGVSSYTVTCTNASGVTGSATVSLSTGEVPPTPTLAVASTSVLVGTGTTISWSSAYASGCTASGAWSGSLAPSGSQTLTPTAAGTNTYSLTCGNVVGQSTPASAVLSVEPQAPAAPTLTLASSSITAGGSTTLTWSSANATSCTASGAWSGTLATSGSQSVTASSTGTYTYSLECSNATGASPMTSASLTVTAAPSSGHGGGAFDGIALLGLAGLAGARLTRAGRRARQPTATDRLASQPRSSSADRGLPKK